MDSYTFTSRATRTAHYAGWYTVDLDTPVVVAPKQGEDSCWFAVVIRTDKALAYNQSDEKVNTGFGYEGSGAVWYYGSDSAPWMIKAIGLTGLYSYATVTSQPKSVTTETGSKVAFSVKAEGGGLTYQWYYRTSGSGTWQKSTLTGCQTDTLTLTATSARNGYQYKCRISNPVNTVYSRAVTLTALKKPAVTASPSSVTAYVGTTAKFTVKTTGDDLSYQWYYRTSASDTWKKTSLTGNKTATLTVPATEARSGYQYKCKISNALGTVYSKAATLTVPATAARNGYQYKCKVTNAKGYVYSNAVTLKVK